MKDFDPGELMRNMGGMFPGLGDLPRKFEEMQARLAREEVTGEAGAGMVKVTMTCSFQVKRVEVDETIVDPNDKDFMEDMIAAAFNVAISRAKERHQEIMQEELGFMSGLMPNLF